MTTPIRRGLRGVLEVDLMENECRQQNHQAAACRGLARVGALAMLLVAAVWLGGCSTRSYFVCGDSWGYRRSYSHERYDCDWDRRGGEWGHGDRDRDRDRGRDYRH